MFKNRQIEIPMCFNGYTVPFIAHICKVAQNILNKITPNGYNPTPFVKKNDVGCEAVFKTKAMADKVEDIMRDVATLDFPIDNHRVIEVCFHIAIQDDSPENYIYHIDGNTFLICHSDPGHAENICGRMKEFFDSHIFQLPIVLVADLIEICKFPLKEDERLLISCGNSTFIVPMPDKENDFFEDFCAKIDRLKETDVHTNGIQFATMKQICSEIGVKGVFYYITPEHVKLTGMVQSLKSFSEILKRRIREKQTRTHVLSRK